MGLTRLNFDASSPLLAALFLQAFDSKKLYSAVRFVDFFGDDLQLDLADGLPEASGAAIARIATSKQAANAAAVIGLP